MGFANERFLCSPAWLVEHSDDKDLVIVDCGWDDSAYRRAHLPGAVFRTGHAYIKGLDAEGNRGLHLPGASDFGSLTAALGIGPTTMVVVYDDWGSLYAARMWWMLRAHGHDDARLLDGGFQGWVEAGHPVSFVATDPIPLSEPTGGLLRAERVIGADELRAGAAAAQIVDVRSDAEFAGEADRGNRRAGHVPGARHLEWNRLLHGTSDRNAVRRLRSPQDIAAMFEQAGIEPGVTPITYCQAGIRAAFGAFVFELMGYPTPRVYDGSMAEWANLDDTELI